MVRTGRREAKSRRRGVKTRAGCWTRPPLRVTHRAVERVAGIELRTLRPAEREAVLDLLGGWEGDREFFARYHRHDPSFRDDLCFVALDRGRLVGTAQVFRRTIRLAAGLAEVAAVANVFTHPDHRGRGIASALLRRARAALPAHGFDLSLLFATRLPFYARLGWRSHVRRLVILDPATVPATGTVTLAPFRDGDLPVVAALYDAFTAKRIGPTVRSPAYWRGQLRFAGNPAEDFLLARDGGQLVAYARATTLFGLPVVMEHAYAAGHARALADLVVTLHGRASTDGAPATVTQLTGDTEVLEDLAARGITHRPVDDVFWLWDIVRPDRVAAAAGIPRRALRSDDALLRVLPPDRSVYWISDRF